MVIVLKGARRLLMAAAGVLVLSWLVQTGVVEPLVQTATAVVQSRRVPVYKVDTPEKKLAISFDATWGTEHTGRLLDLLDRFNVKTTFFLAGNWLEKYPEWVREIARRGHEIGNHSYAHAHMNSLSPEEIRRDLARAHGLIKEITGRDAGVFRPPFGEYSNKVIEEAEKLGYITVQWSIDSLDWKDVSAAFMVERVMKAAGPGDIVLFHNGGKHTPEAVETILTRLLADGYQIVPVGELIYREDFEIEPHSGLQRRRRPQPPPAPAPAQGRAPGDGPAGGRPPQRGPLVQGGRLEQAGAASPQVPVPDSREPVFHVQVAQPVYALAVNVDWGEENLGPMLDTFQRYGVRATFFPTGRWARLHPGWVRRFVEEGHEVGNHGSDHRHPKQLSDQALRELVEGGARLLDELTGGRAVNLFAPPYGEFDPRIVGVARASGHATVMWTIDTIDWQRPPPDVIVRRVVDRIRPGAIILMHPVAETVAALPQMLEKLAAAGYRPMPVGELVRLGAQEAGEGAKAGAGR